MSRDRVSRRVFLKTAGAVAALGALPTVGRAQAKEVKLGYILPVTGPLAFEAQLSLNGLQLAVDEINAAGGVKALGGAKLTLLAGRHPAEGRAGQLRGGAADRPGRDRADRAVLQPGRLLGAAGDGEEQDAVHAAGRRGRQPHRGRAALRLPRAAQRQGHGDRDHEQHRRDGQGRQRAAQARGDDARGRQLRHHDGQPRGGLRRPARLHRGAAHSLQHQVAGLHRRAVEGEGVQARSAGHQRLLRRLQDHRRDGGQAAHRRARAGGPGQRRLLEPQVHRRQPRADRPALRRQLLAQPAIARGPRPSSPPTRSASAPR